ncbi:hypothetical protein [Dankookia sp. P2]|uniref:hypothetical protein n=1 Tax=Dankookia sp. P2 TaxID=3423955 RepID=UPI003D667D75
MQDDAARNARPAREGGDDAQRIFAAVLSCTGLFSTQQCAPARVAAIADNIWQRKSRPPSITWKQEGRHRALQRCKAFLSPFRSGLMSSAAQTRVEEIVQPGVDGITRRLTAWAEDVVRRTQTGTSPPAVKLTLVQIHPRAAPAGAHAAFELALDYRCTAIHEQPLDVQRALGEIAFAAMESGICTVAAATPDRLGLILTARLARSRTVPRGPRVQVPLRVRAEPAAILAGRVLGPGLVPLAGVTVSAGSGDRLTATGPDGRFQFLGTVGLDPSSLVIEIDGLRQGASVETTGAEITFHVAMER